MSGPLDGIRIVEFAGLGPAPFAAMMLADHGAEVLRIARPGGGAPGSELDLLSRGRRHLGLDLKQPGAADIVLRLIERADGLIEGFRPGVMERLGLSPEVCQARNPRLVYGRATGWGQHGPLAQAAGHDINYVALAGTLHCIGPAGEPPTPVPGFIGDFGGGGMLLAFGMLAALLASRDSGGGRVVDAAISDGAALLATLNHGWRHVGLWHDEAGTNMGDGGAHFYNTYRCADGRDIAVGAIEPAFHSLLIELLGLQGDPDFGAREQWRRDDWPRLKQRLAALFATRPRDEWCTLLEGTDACFAPVLSLGEAPQHPHHCARGTFGSAATPCGAVLQPAPAPRFAIGRETAPAPAVPATAREGEHSESVLRDAGFSEPEIAALVARRLVWCAAPP